MTDPEDREELALTQEAPPADTPLETEAMSPENEAVFSDAVSPEEAAAPVPQAEMPRAERAANAARRRREETERAVEAARSEERARLKASLAGVLAEADGSGQGPYPDRAALARELAAIRELDPGVRDAEELLSGERGDRILAAMETGVSLSDAWLLANRERLAETIRRTERQRTLSSLAGKSHLTATESRGNGAPAVPAGEMAYYRRLNPKVPESEIRVHYTAYRAVLRGR